MAQPRLKSEWQNAARTLGVSDKGSIPAIKSNIMRFGYAAGTDKGRRTAPKTRPQHESKIATVKIRKRIQATAQQQNRDLSLVAWMIRNHIDYTSSFHLSFRSKDEALNELVNMFFRWHGRPKNFDIAERLGREESFRLFEMEKVVSGDAGFVKLSDLKLQGLESDLIAKGVTPENETPKQKTGREHLNDEGLVIDGATGRKESFGVCNRGPKGDKVTFDHLEPADNVIFDGYWSRFVSQYRGISPLTTAINMVQDIHEGFEYNLVKGKMQALFGIAITRNPGGEDSMGGAGGSLVDTVEDTTVTNPGTGAELDLAPDSINILDMNPGEQVDTIESKTPTAEFVDGSYLFIQIALLSLDIPITFFDSRRSSFSGGIADLNKYEKACKWKQNKNRYARTDYSDWAIEQLWDDPEFKDWGLEAAAKKAGLTMIQVQALVEWIPDGSPWMDKLKQIKGDDIAIELRIDNALDASRRRGGDVYKNVDKQLAVEKYELNARATLGLPPRVSGDPTKYDSDLTNTEDETPPKD